MDQAIQQSPVFPIARSQVRDILTKTAAYHRLPKADQVALAHDMVKVAAFIAGGDGSSTPTSATILADTKPADPAGDTASARLKESGATAAQQGTEQLANVVDKVNFPKFVAGLIDGVFNAIVTSSIKQMQAYMELVQNVAKSVDQYMQDNITENGARDYLESRYPDYLEVDTSGDKPVLKPKDGYDEGNLPRFHEDLGMKEPVTSLDEDSVEQQLVPAARRRMAMDRQQLLATLVLMGINRLIVTDGSISASVLFEVNTRDRVGRKFNRASQYDFHEQTSRSGGGGFWGWLSGADDTSDDTQTNYSVSTTRSEDSESKVDLHAKLTGKVDVKFKSDVVPLEKMADAMQVSAIREKTPANRSAAPAPAPGR
jgi:hypothetical protein